MSKSWIYHRTKEPKIVDDLELAEYFRDGWADTPAAFNEAEESFLREEEPEPEEDLDFFEVEFETEEEAEDTPDESFICASENELSLEMMTKKELQEFCQKHFEVTLPHRLGRDMMEERVRDLLRTKHGEDKNGA